MDRKPKFTAIAVIAVCAVAIGGTLPNINQQLQVDSAQVGSNLAGSAGKNESHPSENQANDTVSGDFDNRRAWFTDDQPKKNRLQTTSADFEVLPEEDRPPSEAARNQAIRNQWESAFQGHRPPDLNALSQAQRELLTNLPPVCSADLIESSAPSEKTTEIAAEQPSSIEIELDEMTHSKLTDRTDQPLQQTGWSTDPNNRLLASSLSRADGTIRNPEPSPSMPSPHGGGSADLREQWNRQHPGQDPHQDVFSRDKYPSAVECAQCHQQIFDEWASSSHAYASISPMFHRFEDTINELAQGTIGYFCMRCHAPVATQMELRRDQPIWDGPRVFREGVTCVACHRVKENYTKTNGERIIEPGDIYQPVYGGTDGIGVEKASKYKDYFKTKVDPADRGTGQPMHRRAIKFEQLSKSEFCMSCHQVAVQPGIKLEVVWDQYRASPAYRNGVTCQDCHMGKVPGVDEGYTVGPAAVMSGKAVDPERKHSNHVFYGPGYSIAHPGIFPQNAAADRWSVNQWLQFDWRAGWGTEPFEEQLADGIITVAFPHAWSEPDDRYDAREIVEANLKKLHYKKDLRRQLIENGSKIDGPFFSGNPAVGKDLKFNYCVTNLNPGHNMPSGSLGAQPQLWLNVVLIGPGGNRLWESGYLDSVGDLADLQSEDVLHRRIPLDKQLFNLQTKFLTSNVKGSDREMYLPINLDVDQLPFIRPAPQPVTVLNHPPGIRMESHSLPPLGSRRAKYKIPARLLVQPGTYRLSVRMRSRSEPIYFMKFCKSTPEMIRMMNEWIVDAHGYTTVFEVK